MVANKKMAKKNGKERIKLDEMLEWDRVQLGHPDGVRRKSYDEMSAPSVQYPTLPICVIDHPRPEHTHAPHLVIMPFCTYVHLAHVLLSAQSIATHNAKEGKAWRKE